MFGDVPDPAVTTVQVGFGTIFGRAREIRCTVQRGFRGLVVDSGLTREPRLGLAVGSGLCRRSRAERREEREARRLFPETENVRR